MRSGNTQGKASRLPMQSQRPPAHLSIIDVDAIDEDTIGIDAHRDASPGPKRRRRSAPVSPSYDDPTPDVHSLFTHYNAKYFDCKLTNVYVEFSSRMTLCAGTCTFHGPVAGCRIALSEPLLKFRSACDLRSTLLHEMIHAHLFNHGISRDGPDGHGPMFQHIAQRINDAEPSSVRVTPYHHFIQEVEHYRTHHWKCTKCDMLIKRSMNRPPGPNDNFWPSHLKACKGRFLKIRSPTAQEKGFRSSQHEKHPKLRARALRGCTTGGTTTQAYRSKPPPGVLHTFRIDDMLKSRTNTKTVACPACSARVSLPMLTRHLDRCLSSDVDGTTYNRLRSSTIPQPPAGLNLGQYSQCDGEWDSSSFGPTCQEARGTTSKHSAVASTAGQTCTSSRENGGRSPSDKPFTNSLVSRLPYARRDNSTTVSLVWDAQSHNQITSQSEKRSGQGACNSVPVRKLDVAVFRNTAMACGMEHVDYWSNLSEGTHYLLELALDPQAATNGVTPDLTDDVCMDFTPDPSTTHGFSHTIRPFLGTQTDWDFQEAALKLLRTHNPYSQPGDSPQQELHSREFPMRHKALKSWVKRNGILKGDGTYVVPDALKVEWETVIANQGAVEQVHQTQQPQVYTRTETAVEKMDHGREPDMKINVCDAFRGSIADQQMTPKEDLKGKDDAEPFLPSSSEEKLPRLSFDGRDGADELKVCPVCDESMGSESFTLHVVACLETSGIQTEFTGAETGVVGPSKDETLARVAPVSSKCPICDFAVEKNYMEEHVEKCMISNGLVDAF